MAVIDGVTNKDVLTALFDGMPVDERAILCSVPGDPATADPTVWGGRPWRAGVCPLPVERNNYVAISSFKANAEDGRFRRRKDQFGATRAIMVDDIGTKLRLDSLPRSVLPSLVVETSPGNYQASYFLTRPQVNRDLAEDAIKQIIGFVTGGGVDPGMAGVTRVMRLPEGINGKPKYARDGNPWRCRVHLWRPDVRTAWEDLQRAFGIVERTKTYVEPDDPVIRERKRGFVIVRDALQTLGLVKRNTGSGWLDIRCPWLSTHTDRADSGTAIAPPMRANGFYGGFKCHHGHCESKTWGDLEEWVARASYLQGQRTLGDFDQ